MKNKSYKHLVCELLDISDKSFYRWREERKIFNLLEKYFTKEDLQEFLVESKISRLERLKELEDIEKKYNKLVKAFKENEVQI